ncbi:MAG: hypothetical protein FWD39_02885, partial [Clostridiales bacterium]|nr:hypothetical protein [Clostridiales bacterium]
MEYYNEDNVICALEKKGRKQPVFAQMRDSFALISKFHGELSTDAGRSIAILPSAEWVLDNFYLLPPAAASWESALPAAVAELLPLEREGELAGLPRVYAKAVRLVESCRGKLPDDLTVAFGENDGGLLMSELGLTQVFLEMALLRCLASLCREVMLAQRGWRLAERLDISSPNWTEKAEKQIGSFGKMQPAYLEHLFSRLRSAYLSPEGIMPAVAARLEPGETAESLIHREHEEEASRQMSMGNIFGSFKLLAGYDWTRFFEETSKVEAALKKDGVYAAMDEESRREYCRLLQKQSREWKKEEGLLAETLLALAKENAQDRKKGHIGYYLLEAEGRRLLAERLGVPFVKPRPFLPFVYIGGQLLIALLAGLLAGYAAFRQGGWLFAVLLGGCFLLVGWQLGHQAVNRFCAGRAKGAPLPRLDFSRALPADCAAAVVVPALLSDAARAAALARQLEVHYLANPLENTYFVLLGDLADGPREREEGDENIISAAEERIRLLNRRYGERFLLLTRRRTFAAADGVWRGWERKRGALLEFNDWLAGKKGSFTQEPSGGARAAIRYVLTVDADTHIGIGNVAKLVGTIAHPLNKAVADERLGRVTEGYGLIQPRIEVDMARGVRSFFSRIFAGEGGIDAYSSAGYDPYQDLWGEAIFTGKGVYDAELFRRLLNERIAENRVLSHDLLEGSILRTGLAKDIRLFDGYPAGYLAWLLRLHRWTRGDWQLLPWLFSRVKNKKGEKKPNPLNGLSKWKIVDNMRRSLLYPAYWLAVLTALFLSGGSFLWLCLTLAA